MSNSKDFPASMADNGPDNRMSLNLQTSRRSSDLVRGWDVFETTIRDHDGGDPVFYDKLMKFIKLFVLIISFGAVFIGCIVSRGSVLLMTSMISDKHMNICFRKVYHINPDNTTSAKYHLIKTDNISLSLSASTPNIIDNINTNKHTIVNDAVELTLIEERVAWLWTLFFALIFPELLTFMRCIRICLLKEAKKPTTLSFLVILLIECLVAIGLAIFEFLILPETNCIFSLLMTSSLAFFPSLINLFAYESGQTSRWTLMFNGLAFIAQIASLIVWPLYFSLYENRYSQSMLIFMPIVMVLISLRWAENYIPTKTILSTLTTKYDDLIDHLRNSINTEARYFIYLFVAPCKVIITFIILITTVWIQDGHIYYLFQNFSTFHRAHTIILESDEHSPATHNDTSPSSGPDFTAKSKIHIHLLIVYMVSSFICYTIAKFACKICVQRLGFALPLTLTCPVIMIILSLSCSTKRKYACLVYNYFPLLPEHVFWSCPSRELLSWDNQNFQILFTLWLITWLSSVWTANHIWSAPKERASKTEKLFFSPLYIGAILDQSLAFNRRRDESKIRMDDDLDKDQHLVTGGLMNMGDIEISDNIVHDSDRITRIYACATMWHETSEEMLQFLKSIMRMDEDQSARENAQKYLKIIDPDFYQFETHIMMDDAFTPSDEDPSEMVVNRYVHQLVGVVNEAASMVHKTHLKLRPPCKIPTPYGGRLIWTLPGRNKLIVHLKDKALVRVRKRWSQVMYMYYLLGHLLMDSTLHINRKAVRGENTYLLALDGDIDFRASAVLLLVDLMKKNRNLGAACGRIHPIGTGLMVWYQKFEYAVSHWLQKATEHVFGCVLCSPGCFSLFRARALMSPNVMKRYAVQCKEPREYVQFDQGEDRWLCTLLLQSGYRVEYNAASDAYTHCPETFVEFYNQRRRWAPSTMANILDLLGDYKNVVRVNRDISYAYIVYHGFLMAGTILGPGTILLMLMGAINGVFGIDNARSLAINLFPVIIFIIICFVADKDIQLFVAQILSLLYVFLMLAVMVGTAIQAKDQPLSPSTIFFVLLISIFMIAALMHPREFSCFLSFPIYFLCIPSMYLLLTLYSLINLNVVTWGTRESTPPPTAPSTVNKNSNSTPMSNNNANGSVNMGNGQANGKLSAAAAAKANYLHLLNINDVPENSEASVSFSFGNIFKCLLCTHEPSEPTDSTSQQLAKIEDALHNLDQKITRLTSTSTHRKRRSTNDFIEHEESSETLESSDDDADTTSVHTTDTTTSSLMPMDPIHSSNRLMKKNSDLQHEHTHLHVKLSKSNSGKNRRDVNRNPRWMDDDIFKDSPVLYLSDHETTFWREMIKKYLFPLDSDKEHEKRVSLGLKELRDKVMFAVLMLNGIFIMTIYLLQSNRDKLSIRLPFRFDLAPQIEADDKSGLDSNKLMILSNVTIIRNEHHHQATSTLSPIDIEEDRVNSNLEPVGATFILFFAIILVLQVIGMLKHRLSTFSHILAFVKLDFCRRPKENINEDDFFGRNAIEIAKDLQCLRGIDEDSSNAQDEAKSTLNRQNTIFNLERKKNKHKTKTMTLDVAFKKRFLSLSSRNRQEINHLPHNLRRKQAILALERRRVSLASSESNTVPTAIGTEKPTHDSDSPPVRISQLMNHTFYQEEEEEEEEGREQLSQHQQEYSQMSDSIENVCTENIEFKMLPGHSKRGLIPASVSFAELSADESINQRDHHQYLTVPDRLDAGGFESNSCSEASFWSPSGSRDIYHDNYGYDSDSDSKVNILKHSR